MIVTALGCSPPVQGEKNEILRHSIPILPIKHHPKTSPPDVVKLEILRKKGLGSLVTIGGEVSYF